jgi:hypothetical protein
MTVPHECEPTSLLPFFHQVPSKPSSTFGNALYARKSQFAPALPCAALLHGTPTATLSLRASSWRRSRAVSAGTSCTTRRSTATS